MALDFVFNLRALFDEARGMCLGNIRGVRAAEREDSGGGVVGASYV